MKDSPKVKIKKSSAGLGLFAVNGFKKGEVITEYTGETISEEESNQRGGKYLVTLNEKWVIDGKSRSNKARYINHACKPNAYFELTEDETQVFVVALRNIKPAEEITVNYGKEYFEQHIQASGCRCGNCASVNT